MIKNENIIRAIMEENALLREEVRVARRANRAKEELLSTMSHEIRTPVSSIVGMLDLVLNMSLTYEQREYLQTVKSSADHLLGLLDHALEFSRMEAGRLELDKIDFDLRSSLEAAIQSLAVSAGKKGLELVCHIDRDTPTYLVGDPGRMRQIIINLVGNAIKFTDAGHVLMTCEVQELLGDAVVLRFTVTDTGIGIPDDKRESIFEPFRQVDGSIARRYGGTGLGLSISKKLVETMGGRIWVESELGVGSSFHFTLQLALQRGDELPRPHCDQDDIKQERRSELIHALKSASEDAVSTGNAHCQASIPSFRNGEPRPGELKAVSKLRILLAEDNPVNQMVTVGILEKHGHSVTIAEDGRRAIRLLEKQQFDLVLMDVGMPVMDGIKTVKNIRNSSSSFQSIPIIAMTAYPIRTYHAICIEAGMNDYLTKPINSERLLAVVARWTRQEEKCLSAEVNSDASLEKVIDVDQAISRMGGDTALFREALEIFLQDASERVQLLRNAIERTDYGLVRKIAHRLGGAASSVGAVGVQAVAGELEKMGEGRNIAGYHRTLSLLQIELEKARGISNESLLLDRA